LHSAGAITAILSALRGASLGPIFNFGVFNV
jgi:hypothetical protein